MPIVRTLIALGFFATVAPSALAAPVRERFTVEPPTQIVRLRAFLNSPVECAKATSDVVSPDVCRIDVNVSVKGGKCDVTLQGEVHTRQQHRTIEWVVKNKGGADDIRFADFTNFSSILPRDAAAFGPFDRASGGGRVSTTQRAKGGSYYYIFLQYSTAGKATEYCEVVDPIINNDDGP